MTYRVDAALDFHQLIAASNGTPVTDSLLVAKAFGKQHKDVLHKLKNIGCSADFTERNFTLCFKNNELQNNKPQPFYEMTKDGFMFLVMGFTGKKAAAVKEAYINAFNWMAGELAKLSKSYEVERNAVMLEYMKERDVASMSGRLLNRWGRVKKPVLLARIDQLEQEGQFELPLFNTAS